DRPVVHRGAARVAGRVGGAHAQGVCALGEPAVVLGRGAGAEGVAVQAALEGGALGGGEDEAGVDLAGGVGGGRVERDAGSGRVDRPVVHRGAARVAGRVGGAHAEGVCALGEPAVVLGRGAGAEGVAVQAALEGGALGGGEGEAGVDLAGGVGGGRVERDAGSGRVDRPVVHRGAARVAGRVGGAHAEGVCALGEPAVVLGRGAGAEGVAVQAALEGGALGGGEGEAGVDLVGGVGGGRVEREPGGRAAVA